MQAYEGWALSESKLNPEDDISIEYFTARKDEKTR
jgi:hypothetical protein